MQLYKAVWWTLVFAVILSVGLIVAQVAIVTAMQSGERFFSHSYPNIFLALSRSLFVLPQIVLGPSFGGCALQRGIADIIFCW